MDRVISALTILILATFAACTAPSELDVPIAPLSGSGVSGRALLSASASGTNVKLDLAGLKPAGSYRVQLQAGACDSPSASTTLIADVVAEKDGKASATAPLRFRGSDDLDLRTLSDGSRIITVRALEGGAVACGRIAGPR